MEPGALEGRHVLLVVAPERFCETELSEARAVFEGRGALVDVASTAAGPARGDAGAEIVPDVTVMAADPHRYDAVVLIGGEGADAYLWEHGPLHALLRLAHEAGAPVGAGSHAAPALARAGLLRDVRATTFGDPRAKHELVRGGALYVEEDLVADRNIITSARGHAARALAEQTVLAIVGGQPARARSRRKEA